jgi:membrane-associated phospholipid phosphatase
MSFDISWSEDLSLPAVRAIACIGLVLGGARGLAEPVEVESSWTAGQILEGAAYTLAGPFELQAADLWVLAPATVGTAAAVHYDVSAQEWIHGDLPDPSLGKRRLSYYGSYLGEGYVSVGVFGAMGIVGLLDHDRRAQRTCLEGLEAVLATGVTTRILKLAVREPRPSDATTVQVFSPNWRHSDSFPSGHTAVAFASATVLSGEYPGFAPLFYALATYVGIARVQQNTHWVSDVVAGAAIGWISGVSALRANRKFSIAPLAQSGSGQGLALNGEF